MQEKNFGYGVFHPYKNILNSGSTQRIGKANENELSSGAKSAFRTAKNGTDFPP